MRQINGNKFDVNTVVASAIAESNSKPLNTEAAKRALAYLGHVNPTEAYVAQYAREAAILKILAIKTGANGFDRQIGVIDFTSNETIIAGVNDYLNRRNAGHRASFKKKYL